MLLCGPEKCWSGPVVGSLWRNPGSNGLRNPRQGLRRFQEVQFVLTLRTRGCRASSHLLFFLLGGAGQDGPADKVAICHNRTGCRQSAFSTTCVQQRWTLFCNLAPGAELSSLFLPALGYSWRKYSVHIVSHSAML